MAVAGAVIASVGAVVGAVGQYRAGQENKSIARRNAELGRMRAVDSEKRGVEESQQVREEFERIKGSQKVGFATQNISLDVGNPQEVLEDTKRIAELEVNTIKNNAALEAWGFRTGAQESILQGRLASTRGGFGAAGTLLQGAGQAISLARTPKAKE